MTLCCRALTLAVLAACALAPAAPPQATFEQPADQVFVFDDAEYTLRDNGTWSCSGKGCRASAEDFTVELTDGRTIVLGVDSSWHPMEKGELVGTKDILVRQASVTTSCTNLRIDVAEQMANRDAIKKMAAKIAAGAPKRKITATKVQWCLSDQRISPDLQKKRDPKGTWTVTASIALQWPQVFNLIRCAQDLVEDTAAAAGAK